MPLRNTIIAMLWPFFNLYSQSKEITPLKIGDPVPDIQFSTMINHSSPSAKLSDFKGKLVILDFWATWCTSCIHGFPKLDSLQRLFDNKIQVLLVNNKATKDDVKKVQKFYTNWQIRTGNNLNLPTSATDTVAKLYFPHKMIPHYVWIDQNGKLIAYTSAEQVNATNILSILEGGVVNFNMKIDQDITHPLFTNEYLPKNNLLKYSIFLKGYIEGLPGGERPRYINNKLFGMAMTNRTILEMYQAIARKINPEFDNRNFVVELEILENLNPPNASNDLTGWYKNNYFSFDYFIANVKETQFFEQMLQELNKLSGFHGEFEKRKRECYVLKRTSRVDKLKTIGGIKQNMLWDKNNLHLKNVSMDILVQQLNYKKVIKEIIYNETNYKGNIDIYFIDGLSDLTMIQKQLSFYGLKLKKVNRVVDVFALSDK